MKIEDRTFSKLRNKTMNFYNVVKIFPKNSHRLCSGITRSKKKTNLINYNVY